MIACNLKELMIKNNLYDFGKLSKETGVPKETLEHLAADTWHQVKREHLEALCRYFSCRVGDLLTYDLIPGGELPA